jgi:hypothetical protein
MGNKSEEKIIATFDPLPSSATNSPNKRLRNLEARVTNWIAGSELGVIS